MYDETHARIADRAAIPTTSNEWLPSWRPGVAQTRTCTQAQVRLALRILITMQPGSFAIKRRCSHHQNND